MMALSKLARHLVFIVREEGMAGVSRIVRPRLAAMVRYLQPSLRARDRIELEFDRKLNVDTRGSIPRYRLDVDADEMAHGRGYQPSPLSAIDEALSRLPAGPPGFTFLDIGAGKGRVVLFAAMRPFDRVVGVEVSKQLSDIASENIRLAEARGILLAPVEIETVNAREFRFPNAAMVVYLYNPFTGPLFADFLANLCSSLRECPREAYLIFHGQYERAMVESAGMFELVDDTGSTRIYRAT